MTVVKPAAQKFLPPKHVISTDKVKVTRGFITHQKRKTDILQPHQHKVNCRRSSMSKKLNEDQARNFVSELPFKTSNYGAFSPRKENGDDCLGQ